MNFCSDSPLMFKMWVCILLKIALALLCKLQRDHCIWNTAWKLGPPYRAGLQRACSIPSCSYCHSNTGRKGDDCNNYCVAVALASMACCGRWCERNSCNLVAALCFVLFALVQHFPKSNKSSDREWWGLCHCLCLRLVLADFFWQHSYLAHFLRTECKVRVSFTKVSDLMISFIMMYVSLVSFRSSIPSLRSVYLCVYCSLFFSHDSWTKKALDACGRWRWLMRTDPLFKESKSAGVN